MTINPIQELRSQYRHVTKHLYAPEERWDLAIAKLPDCPNAAQEAGCTAANLLGGDPHGFDRACEFCRRVVIEHHDSYMAPAYLKATAEPIEHALFPAGCQGYVGKNGVFTIVGPRHIVRTAYRRPPAGGRGARDLSNKDFVLAAAHKLRWKATQKVMPPSRRAERIITEELETLLVQREQAPLGRTEGYWLLVLLGHARQLESRSPRLSELVSRAERAGVLTNEDRAVALPDSKGLLAELTCTLTDDEEPQGELHDCLIDIDDLIAVLELRQEEPAAQFLAARAVSLVARYPERVEALAGWSQKHLEELSEETPSRLLWQAVAQAQGGVRSNLWHRLVSLIDWQPVMHAWQPALAAPHRVAPTVETTWSACYQDGEDLVVQVLLEGGKRLQGIPELQISTARGMWRRPVSLLNQTVDALWFNLGSEEQLSALLAEARTTLGGEATDAVAVQIWIDLRGEDTNGPSA